MCRTRCHQSRRSSPDIKWTTSAGGVGTKCALPGLVPPIQFCDRRNSPGCFSLPRPRASNFGRERPYRPTELLHDAGVLQQPLLYLSLYFKQHRDEYYRLLARVRATGDWGSWLDFSRKLSVPQPAPWTRRSGLLFKEDTARLHPAGRSATMMLCVPSVAG
jgi:hypothetical protein